MTRKTKKDTDEFQRQIVMPVKSRKSSESVQQRDHRIYSRNS